MALLLDPATRVLDTTGAAINGGQVRVYNANTTTLADIFSDAGLSVALSNPVVCNSTGYPSSNGTTPTLIFAAAANYDVAFLDTVANGSTVLRSWEDVPSVGSDEATLYKDFTNSRFQVRGSGGTIYVEAGDASPDNTGGTMRLGGWSGTEADTITLDGALVNVDGVLKENSKKLPGVIYTDATTFSTSTGVAIQLPNTPTGVRQWEIEVWDLVAAGTVALTAQLSFDSGATYKSGAADYIYDKWIMDNTAGPGIAVSPSTGDTKIDVSYALRAPAGKPARMTIKVTTPNSGSDHTLVESSGTACDRTAATSLATFGTSGSCVGGYGRATHIKLAQGANLISGYYRITPKRGSGET